MGEHLLREEEVLAVVEGVVLHQTQVVVVLLMWQTDDQGEEQELKLMFFFQLILGVDVPFAFFEFPRHLERVHFVFDVEQLGLHLENSGHLVHIALHWRKLLPPPCWRNSSHKLVLHLAIGEM